MIVPHPARADAAERHVVLPHLHDRLIHADAARENLGDVPLGESLVVGERIERERAIVADLPEPVMPSNVWNRSPASRPADSALIAAGCAPAGSQSDTTWKRFSLPVS